jgi:hypothetical protein
VVTLRCVVCGQSRATNCTGYSRDERALFVAAMAAVGAFWMGTASYEESG